MSDLIEKSYEDLPYGSENYFFMHPDRLASVGVLAGLTPPPPDRCRVLEIGCASGGNLIPAAEAIPGSTFVGIDLSPRQIRQGQEVIDGLGLKNVQLAARNIMDVGPEIGKFDYIVCHGVYSWVPPDVQAKILDVCREHLTPDGLACVSYTQPPGWHQRGMVREMMLYHVDSGAAPMEQVRQAKELVELLNSAVVTGGTPDTSHEMALKEELGMLRNSRHSYVFHEHLEAYNTPVYFHQFAARVAAKGLRYVGAAMPDVKSARVTGVIDQMPFGIAGDPIRREQYLDFVAGRSFRESVMCHADKAVNYQGDLGSLARLSVLGFLRVQGPPPDLASTTPVTFVAMNGAEMTVGDPVVKGALTVLAQAAPWPVPVPELCREVQRLVRGSTDPIPAQDYQRMARSLVQCNRAATVEFHAYLPPCVKTPGERPKVGEYARRQAAAGRTVVTNRWHRSMKLPPLDVVVLQLLDGTRDRVAIAAAVRAAVESPSGRDGPPGDEGAAIELPSAPEEMARLVETSLNRIAIGALLVA